MPFGKLTLLAFAAMLLVVLFMAVLLAQRDQERIRNAQASSLETFEGKLDIRAIDDLRVDGRKVLLCGVLFTKPQAMRSLVTQAARREFQGALVNCRPVGAGTPCDGKAAARFNDAAVVQCFTSQGVDLAETFSANGYLCDQPALSGGYYQACARH